MNLVEIIIQNVKDQIYWQVIFPRLDYTKKMFTKIKHANGSVTYIRRRRKGVIEK